MKNQILLLAVMSATAGLRAAEVRQPSEFSADQLKVAVRKRYPVTRFLTGAAQLGLAGAGVQQLLAGNTGIGGGLLAGAGVTSLVRSAVSHRSLARGLEQHHQKLVTFLQQWPEVRASVPASIQAHLDQVYDDFQSKQGGVLTPAQAEATSRAVQALAIIEKAHRQSLSNEYEQWQFLLEQLGLLHSHLGPGRAFASQVPSLLGNLAVWGVFSSLLTTFLIWRVKLFNQYVYQPSVQVSMSDYPKPAWNDYHGHEEYMNERERREHALHQRYKQHPVARWVGWSQYSDERALRLGNPLFASLASLPILYWIIKSGFIAYARKKAREQMFDRFVGIWPYVKSRMPAVVRERFDNLYYTQFDLVTGKLRISNKDRKIFLKQLWIESKPFHKMIREKSSSPSWLQRLRARRAAKKAKHGSPHTRG